MPAVVDNKFEVVANFDEQVDLKALHFAVVVAYVSDIPWLLFAELSEDLDTVVRLQSLVARVTSRRALKVNGGLEVAEAPHVPSPLSVNEFFGAACDRLDGHTCLIGDSSPESALQDKIYFQSLENDFGRSFLLECFDRVNFRSLNLFHRCVPLIAVVSRYISVGGVPILGSKILEVLTAAVVPSRLLKLVAASWPFGRTPR